MKKLRFRSKKDRDEIEEHVQRIKDETGLDEEKISVDILEEQMDKTDTTRHSEDAEFDLEKVQAHPERYIEVNIIKKSRVVDTFFIYADKPYFKYKDKKYNIVETGIYLLPKKGFFVPTCFYYEDKDKPVSFKQKNKGITGKALTLLYKTRLYNTLLKTEDNSYNVFVILFLIIQMILFGVALYFMFVHDPSGAVNGGGLPQL